MRMEHLITLRATTTAPNSTGLAVETATDTTAYADIRSVKRAEYYAANAAGNSVDQVFVVNADDYAGQMQVVHNSVTYNVIRAYQVGLGRVELNCSKG